jgi:hypothetical protein
MENTTQARNQLFPLIHETPKVHNALTRGKFVLWNCNRYFRDALEHYEKGNVIKQQIKIFSAQMSAL